MEQDPSKSETGILVGSSSGNLPVQFVTSMANRHGLICGATGTGKTVTLQVLAEEFSKRGAAVFSADIKGDLSGICQPGTSNEEIERRKNVIGLTDFEHEASPSVFWDVFGENGHPLRASLSEIGPLLLSHMLELNEVQEGVIHIAFRLADEQGLPILDLKDLRQMLIWLSENRKEVSQAYGNVAPQSVAAIQRRLLVLEDAGADKFFGEPAFEIKDLVRQDMTGRGLVHLLDATKLVLSSRLYSTFLLWLLSELFEELDEVGDPEVPKIVFFFDEAHLLFDGASNALLEKVEQVIRLIRSKGVGIYFVTQHPGDIPDSVLSQLGNRFVHSLRAYTTKEQRLIRSVAETFRANASFSTEEAIAQLRTGEALVSTLSSEGTPQIVEQTLVRPPRSNIGPCEQDVRTAMFKRSPYAGKYDKAIDRESAYEMLLKRAEENRETGEEVKKRSPRRQSALEAFFKSVVRSVGYRIGRELVRGVLGTLKRGAR